MVTPPAVVIVAGAGMVFVEFSVPTAQAAVVRPVLLPAVEPMLVGVFVRPTQTAMKLSVFSVVTGVAIVVVVMRQGGRTRYE